MQYIKSILSAIFMLLILTGCSENKKSENLIIIGTSADNPPFEFTKNGQVIGFDIDVIKAIAAELELDIEIKNIDFGSLLPALSSGKIDAIIAGINETPERAKKVAFTNPYVQTINAILTNDPAITELANLHNKHIGAQLGSTWQLIAEDIKAKYAAEKIVTINNNFTLVEELKNKRIDAVILDQDQVHNFINKNPQLSGFVLNDYKSKFAIAVKQDSTLQARFNQAITSLKDSGKLQEIYNKWFLNKE